MSATSNYLENALLNHVFKNIAYTPPTTLYLALFTNISTNTTANLESGILTDEISGGSYARQIITFGTVAGGSISNDTLIPFPTSTSNWGTVTHTAIMDAASGGNVLYYGLLTSSRAITSGRAIEFAIGSVIVTQA